MTVASLLASAAAVSLQQFTDLLEVSVVHDTVDLGCALIYKVTHPESGKLVLVNTVEGPCALVPCD